MTFRQNAKKLPVAEGIPGFPVKPGRKQLYVHCRDALPKIRLRQTFQRIMMSRDLAVELQQHPIAEVKLLVHTSLLSQTFHCANHTVVIRLRQRSIHQQLLELIRCIGQTGALESSGETHHEAAHLIPSHA